MNKPYVVAGVILGLVVLPAIAQAIALGNARLVSVVPVSDGCFDGPNGATVQSWEVERGKAYRVTIADVTDCANGGTDPMIDVRINSSTVGHEYKDLVAYYVSDGVYEFVYTVPTYGVCTFPVFYCTTPGDWLTSGLRVRRDDGGGFQAHLRVAWWGPGCIFAGEILGPECEGGTVPVEQSTWGAIKALYD